ncbi:hypothetical protein Acr_15g0012110 [Actinidia rufa]|uniref:NB-ARC domain-containing disease resistance protein n=1 Tax=Actinidia rufa TaxID=165716 RepID=A0A7J0FV79_9ERIC|nr:hypothetical protein Acr_15g0012110 [Actinidia rufa]
MAVGEIVLAAFIQVLFEKLASGELSNFVRREGIHTALKKWTRMLEEIEAVLADAEEKQITERGIQMWLEDLEDLAYDLDDVLDEIATEALRRKLKHQERLASIRKVSAFIPACLRPSTVLSDFRMKSKLDKITPRLQNLFERRSGFGLQRVAAVASASVAQGRETSSIQEPFVVHGRVEDKKAIMELLLNDQLSNTKFGVVLIVGMGGVGKATLAKMTLEIMKCPQLVVEWLPSPTMPHGMRNTVLFDSLTSLSLYDVSIPCSFNSPEVADEACSPSSSLTSMRLENIQELTCLPSWFLQGMMGLQELTIQEKEGQQQQYEGLPSTLRTLQIDGCDSLQSLPELMMLNNLEILKVKYCSALTCLCPGAGLPSTLKDLIISSCPKLEAVLAEGMTINCPSLKKIIISSCDNLKTLPDVIQNHDLRNLNWCKKLDALPQSAYNKNNHLTSLQRLDIVSSPAAAGIASYVLKEGRSLTNLTNLTISNIDKKPPSEWELGLLTSLSELWIVDCRNLASIAALGLLPSLSELWIFDSPNLASFPDQGLPLSLLQLKIDRCPLLKQRCEKKKGQYWPFIAHIPLVQIDRRFIFDPAGGA